MDDRELLIDAKYGKACMDALLTYSAILYRWHWQLDTLPHYHEPQ